MTTQKVSLAQELFDECDDQSNTNLAMITTIYVNHKTELEDYVKNIALICFYCKYFLLKKLFNYVPVELHRKYIHTYFGEP